MTSAPYSLPKRVALELLRWYPRPWQARYYGEMKALLEEIPVGWRQTANVATIGVREWLSPRALGWPARTAAGRVLAVRALVFFAAALLCDGLSRALARELHRQYLLSDRQLDWVCSLLLTAVCVRIFPVIASARRPRTRRWLSAYKRLRRPLKTWELVTCAVFLFPVLVERHADPPTYSGAKTWSHFVILFLYSRMFVRASLRTWRLQRVEVSRRQNWRSRARNDDAMTA